MNNGILVVDEFDKLAKPRFNSQGENVSVNLQSEFLKMIEHDTVVNQRNPSVQYTLRGLSTVFIGAFESIRVKKWMPTQLKNRICKTRRTTKKQRNHRGRPA